MRGIVVARASLSLEGVGVSLYEILLFGWSVRCSVKVDLFDGAVIY